MKQDPIMAGIAASDFRLIFKRHRRCIPRLVGASDPESRCTKIHYAGWR